MLCAQKVVNGTRIRGLGNVCWTCMRCMISVSRIRPTLMFKLATVSVVVIVALVLDVVRFPKPQKTEQS